MRMPGAPSGVPINSIPADSKHRFRRPRLSFRDFGKPVTASYLLIVAVPTPLFKDSSFTVQPRADLAALICSEVIDESCIVIHLVSYLTHGHAIQTQRLAHRLPTPRRRLFASNHAQLLYRCRGF